MTDRLPGFETAIGCATSDEGDAPQVDVRHLADKGVWVLSAAVGSGAAQERSSLRANDAFAQEFLTGNAPPTRTGLLRAMTAANRVVYDEELPATALMAFATSIVAVCMGPERLIVTHLGNARCYLFRVGERSLLTPPHSAASGLGGGDERSPFATHHRHLLTHALGIVAEIEPPVLEHEPQSGDVLVLINDELSWAVENEGLLTAVRHGARPEAISSHVLGLARRAAVDGALIAVGIGRAPEMSKRDIN